MTISLIAAALAIVVGLLMWRRRRAGEGGFVKSKERMPVEWKVERRKQFKGETSGWYLVSTHRGLEPEDTEEEAGIMAVEYSQLWNIPTRAIPVYGDEEG